jgi:hypothetical protein
LATSTFCPVNVKTQIRLGLNLAPLNKNHKLCRLEESIRKTSQRVRVVAWGTPKIFTRGVGVGLATHGYTWAVRSKPFQFQHDPFRGGLDEFTETIARFAAQPNLAEYDEKKQAIQNYLIEPHRDMFRALYQLNRKLTFNQTDMNTVLTKVADQKGPVSWHDHLEAASDLRGPEPVFLFQPGALRAFPKLECFAPNLPRFPAGPPVRSRHPKSHIEKLLRGQETIPGGQESPSRAR